MKGFEPKVLGEEEVRQSVVWVRREETENIRLAALPHDTDKAGTSARIPH